jgi:hypothetical protein
MSTVLKSSYPRISIQTLAFPFSVDSVQLDASPFEDHDSPAIRVVAAKLVRGRSTLIVVPRDANIPPLGTWGVPLIERLAEILSISTDVAFRPNIFYRDNTGQLNALFLQHELSAPESITRFMMAVPFSNSDTSSVEQQMAEILPHFSDECRPAIEWSLA